jgi:hypothetical protein
MKEKKKVRDGWLNIRLNEDEENKLNRLFSRSKSASLSEYARDVLLQEPVIITYRNQSADDFLAEMILLKNELNAIGKNYNQVVHKLHTLDYDPQFIQWVTQHEVEKNIFLEKVEEIKEKINLIHQRWSQK